MMPIPIFWNERIKFVIFRVFFEKRASFLNVIPIYILLLVLRLLFFFSLLSLPLLSSPLLWSFFPFLSLISFRLFHAYKKQSTGNQNEYQEKDILKILHIPQIFAILIFLSITKIRQTNKCKIKEKNQNKKTFSCSNSDSEILYQVSARRGSNFFTFFANSSKNIFILVTFQELNVNSLIFTGQK